MYGNVFVTLQKKRAKMDHILEYWTEDKKSGEYYLPNFKSFFLKQKSQFPNMTDLYEHQMELIKKDYPKVFCK